MSTNLRLPTDQLAAIRPEDVQLYLASRGWKGDASGASAKAISYSLPNEQDAEVWVPKSKELADYVNRIADIVQMVSAVESRTVWEVLNDLSIPPADVLRLRIAAPDATLGLLPLDEGIRLIEGGRAILLAAACSAHHAQSFYPRQAYREPVDFLQTCQLGQTERGSFIATITAPVPPKIDRQRSLFGEDDEPAFENEPFSRKTTWRLMSALGHINGAIQQGTYDEILAGVSQGISANLCDAVATMQPSGDQSTLQIRMSWSRNRPKVPSVVVPSVSFSQTAFSIIREAGRQLREDSSVERKRVQGFVVGLKAETSLVDGYEGNVTLRVSVGGSPVRVQVVLDRENYAKACDAHRDGRAVAITGLLQREAKLYRLLEPQNFEILQGE